MAVGSGSKSYPGKYNKVISGVDFIHVEEIVESVILHVYTLEYSIVTLLIGNAGPQDRSYLCPYFHDEMRGPCPTPNCKINGSAQFRDDNKDKERGASKK